MLLSFQRSANFAFSARVERYPYNLALSTSYPIVPRICSRNRPDKISTIVTSGELHHILNHVLIRGDHVICRELTSERRVRAWELGPVINGDHIRLDFSCLSKRETSLNGMLPVYRVESSIMRLEGPSLPTSNRRASANIIITGL